MVSEEGKGFVLKARYPQAPVPLSFRAKLKGKVTVHLFLSQEGREPWYLTLGLPFTAEAHLPEPLLAPRGYYALRLRGEEGFRDPKGTGLDFKASFGGRGAFRAHVGPKGTFLHPRSTKQPTG